MNFNFDFRIGSDLPPTILQPQQINNDFHRQNEAHAEASIDFASYIIIPFSFEEDSHENYLKRNIAPLPEPVEIKQIDRYTHEGERQEPLRVNQIIPETLHDSPEPRQETQSQMSLSVEGFHCLVENCGTISGSFARLFADHVKKRKDINHQKFWALNKHLFDGKRSKEREELKARSQELARLNPCVTQKIFHCLAEDCDKKFLTMGVMFKNHLSKSKEKRHLKCLELCLSSWETKEGRDALRERSLAHRFIPLKQDPILAEDLIPKTIAPAPLSNDHEKLYRCPLEDCAYTSKTFPKVITDHLKRKKDAKHRRFWELNSIILKNKSSRQRKALEEQCIVCFPINQANDAVAPQPGSLLEASADDLFPVLSSQEDQETRNFRIFLETINSPEGASLRTLLINSLAVDHDVAQRPSSLAASQEQAFDFSQPGNNEWRVPNVADSHPEDVPQLNSNDFAMQEDFASSWELPFENHETQNSRGTLRTSNSFQRALPFATYLKNSTAVLNSPPLNRRVAVQPAHSAKRQKTYAGE